MSRRVCATVSSGARREFPATIEGEMTRPVSVILILLLLFGVPALVLRALSSHSEMTFDPRPAAIGEATPVTVRISNPHGVRHIAAWIEQNGARTALSESSRAANRMTFWRAHLPPEQFQFTAGKAKEGRARILVEAQSNDFRGAVDSIAAEVEVILRPPSVSADGFQHYINQGGSEMVIYTPSGSYSESGARVGQARFQGFPVPGSPNELLALFAYSWDTPSDTEPFVYVRNVAGAEATAHFWNKVFPKKFHARDFAIDDKFLERVVTQIDPSGSGDLLERFLKINGAMRRENNKTLADLKAKTEPKFFWTEPFVQLANSKVESGFADVRSYIYKGKKVDQQVHLGFDLAVAQHTPVVAANDGKVVWAAPLGIYGNCIVIDHGFALQSIYGHLSDFEVKEGDMVKRGQTIGKSGSTGLAGGDHLHFSMQVGGVQVNPIEWWDAHWIHDHVFGRMMHP
jgi:murein DD-endopeptidase MepM/ murein hydrolase activator NlpD